MIKFWQGENDLHWGFSRKIHNQETRDSRQASDLQSQSIRFIAVLFPHSLDKKPANKYCRPSMPYRQCFFYFYATFFNHYSALKNRWGLYRLESKQREKCKTGRRQPHGEPQTGAPGVNYIRMESCLRACIHKHTLHFGGIKYMHMHNKRHEWNAAICAFREMQACGGDWR